MTRRLKRFAPYFAGIGLLAILAGLAWLVVERRFTVPAEALLGGGAVLLAVYTLLCPDEVRRLLTGRQVRYGSNTAVMVVAFLGILILVNFIAARHYRRFDLTAAKEFSLSPQTRQILEGLEEPVQIHAFITERYPGAQDLQDLLQEYTYYSDKLSLKVTDPEVQPGLARQWGITRDGTIVFVCGDRREDVYGTTEQDITSAILKVSRAEKKVVYFTTGHGERNIDGYSPQDYAQIRQALERDNYEVRTLNLTITDTIPADAAALVIADPRVTLAEQARQNIVKYLHNGGKAMFLLNPSQGEYPLGKMLNSWGLRFRDDIVIDPRYAFLMDPLTPAVSHFPYTQITKDLEGMTVFFPGARSIEEPEESPQGVTINRLVQTSEVSWGETDLDSVRMGKARFDEGSDVKGPLTLAVMVRVDSLDSRLVVIGNADFVCNDVMNRFRGFGNADLFLNAINWLTEEEELISIRPKPLERRLIPPLSPQKSWLILLFTAAFLPLVVIVAGAAVWWRRR